METRGEKRRSLALGDLIDKDVLVDLRDMVNNVHYSDVQFICSDGIRVHASRMLLIRRSPVLKAMLSNGMMESRLSEIPLPETPSCALLCVFEFLYTGELLNHELKDWSTCFNVIKAAKLFCLPILEKHTWEHLSDSCGRIYKSRLLALVAANLSIAVDFIILFENKDHEIFSSLVDTLEMTYDDPYYVRYLSRKAFDYYMGRTKLQCRVDKSIREYYRLRQVCLWVAFTESCKLVEEISQWYMPDTMTAAHMLMCPRKFEEFCSGRPPPHELRLITEKFLRTKASSLLSDLVATRTVDLESLDSRLLVTVVMPLKLFPSSVLTAVLAAQAVGLSQTFATHRIDCQNNRPWTWEDGTSNRVSDNACYERFSVFCKGLKFFRSTTPMWPGGFYEWEIQVDTGSASCFGWNMEIGFLDNNMVGATGKVTLQSQSEWNTNLSSQCGSWCMTLFKHFPFFFKQSEYPFAKTKRGDFIQWKTYPPKFPFEAFAWDKRGYRNGFVSFKIQFNSIQHTCRFSIYGHDLGDHDLGEAWTDIPRGVYFPAFSCNSPELETEIHITALKGFT